MAKQEIKKEMCQQSENLQRRLAERKKKLQLKRSVNNSRIGGEGEETKNESQQSMSGSIVGKQSFGQRPQTVKGGMKKFSIPITSFDDDIMINRDFNDISMIKGSTNFENTQYIEEISFNTDLQLIKKLQDIDIDHSTKNIMGGAALGHHSGVNGGSGHNHNQFDTIFENLDSQFEDEEPNNNS